MASKSGFVEPKTIARSRGRCPNRRFRASERRFADFGHLPKSTQMAVFGFSPAIRDICPERPPSEVGADRDFSVSDRENAKVRFSAISPSWSKNALSSFGSRERKSPIFGQLGESAQIAESRKLPMRTQNLRFGNLHKSEQNRGFVFSSRPTHNRRIGPSSQDGRFGRFVVCAAGNARLPISPIFQSRPLRDILRSRHTEPASNPQCLWAVLQPRRDWATSVDGGRR